MPNDNFRRTYTLKCGKSGEQGFQVGNTYNAIDDVLHISFSIEKCDVESPNTAKVQVWNLSDENLKILDQKDCIVELKAGYNMNNTLILVGNVTAVTTTPENADRMTELAVMDGRVELRDTVISLSINGPVNCRDLYEQVAGMMGLPILFAQDLTFSVFPNGFAYIGKAKGILHKISEYCGHNWTIQNQIIQITLPGRAISSNGFLLSYETGLIGIPKRITIGSSTDKKESQTGWEVEYLLNGAIGVNDVVQLQSSTANGYYRVYKVTLDGDNLQGDWICTAQLLDIKADAVLDAKVNG